MEGYAYSYPDSGDSSPRSREIDFENPPPSWEDQQPPQPPPTHKVKFMVSYGGKIQPRTHDNLLSYVGGETKILAVDRSVKFSSLLSKLSSLIASPDDPSFSLIASFKYQLPGEDLDALISVTNDDDLDHMMHEYDRLYRASPKPARLRLFAFPGQMSSGFGSGSSEPGKMDRERFVEALNSVPVPVPEPPVVVGNSNVDFLFGLDNKVVNPVHDPGRVIISDPQIELNRLQISAQEHQQQPPAVVYRPKSEDNLAGGGYAGDGYQKPPPTIPASVQIPAGYWQPAAPVEQQQQQHYQPVPPQQQPPHQQQQQQPVYMIHTAPPGGVYHAPVGRPVTGQPTQGGYYQMQRVSSDPIYREQPVYNMAQPQHLPGQQAKMGGYTEGMGVPVRQVAGMPENTGGYHQVAYDNGSGRQVYYAAPGVVTAPFQGVAVSGDMRAADGKVGPTKVTQTSAAPV